jgi:peptidyl-tRNA hydrolase, PTH1 family
MKILVGLGNPDKKLRLTRHNVGFLFLNYFQTLLSAQASKFELKSKFEAKIATIEFDNQKLLLTKPQTYMNNSGRAVKKIVDFYKIDFKKDLLLIHDDLDIEFGQYKIDFGKGPKIHNGINSVAQNLSSPDFLRLRLGIANQLLPTIKNQGKSVADDFVLKDFSKEEQENLSNIFQACLPELKQKFNF